MPGKIAETNVDIWTRKGQELATALMQVFMDQRTTTGRIFLRAASTVFQAEVMTVLKYTELFFCKNIERRRIHSCSDSRAAMAALAKTHRIGSGMQALEN